MVGPRLVLVLVELTWSLAQIVRGKICIIFFDLALRDGPTPG